MAKFHKYSKASKLCLYISISLLFIGSGGSSPAQGQTLDVMDLWYREDSGDCRGLHDVPVQGTVGDLARKVLAQIGDRPMYQAVMSYTGYLIEAENILPLSDAGIGPEVTVDIAWKLKPDIELLFEMYVPFDSSSF